MTFGDGGWHAGATEARSIFTRYVAAGGNFIDTAGNYGAGASEEMLGTFMMLDRIALVTGNAGKAAEYAAMPGLEITPAKADAMRNALGRE
jgi:aryl-alcohol dehydrogenase-like predicted oxidoreductase